MRALACADCVRQRPGWQQPRRAIMRCIADAGMPRHLSLSHFAFFRGHLEGLPLATPAQRYLRDGLDETTPKRTLQFFLDTLRALAMKHGQLRYARALVIDPARAADRGARVPADAGVT